MNDVPKLEDLKTWKKCRALRIELKEFTKSLPADEKSRLVDQILRASRSITNNIAERYGRFHFQENVQYLRHSRGSVCECIDHLYVSLDETFINQEKFNELYNECQEYIRLLNGYIKYLLNRKSGLGTTDSKD